MISATDSLNFLFCIHNVNDEQQVDHIPKLCRKTIYSIEYIEYDATFYGWNEKLIGSTAIILRWKISFIQNK